MGQPSRFAPFAIVLILAVILQVALIAADHQQTPIRTAKEFTKDYFYLDPDMQDYLCESLAEEGTVVDNYLYAKRQEADQRGLPVTYLQKMFTTLHLTIEEQDEATATVHVSGTTRVAVNPVFMLVGKWFRIGDNYPVNATLELVKEKEGWRVCGAPFDLEPVE